LEAKEVNISHIRENAIVVAGVSNIVQLK